MLSWVEVPFTTSISVYMVIMSTITSTLWLGVGPQWGFSLMMWSESLASLASSGSPFHLPVHSWPPESWSQVSFHVLNFSFLDPRSNPLTISEIECNVKLWSFKIPKHLNHFSNILHKPAAGIQWDGCRTHFNLELNKSQVHNFGPGGLRAPCVAWPLLLPSFVFFSFSLRLLLLTHFG